MVLVLIGALDGIRGRSAAQQASTSCCKGVHPYNCMPILISCMLHIELLIENKANLLVVVNIVSKSWIG